MKTKNVTQIIKRQDLRNRKHKNENLRGEDSTLQSEKTAEFRTFSGEEFFSQNAMKLSKKVTER
jgi:hypothetical protein